MAGSCGHYKVIYIVFVKIWTNHGSRGCGNPTKPSPTLPCIYDRPSYILPNDGVEVNLICPMGGKFWPLHGNLYSFCEDLDKKRNQRLQQPNQDQPHSPMYIGSSFIHTSKGWCECQSNLPHGGKLWPLHGNLYSFSEDLDK
jgi:hypothetical protein